jgi:hypothetical protein
VTSALTRLGLIGAATVFAISCGGAGPLGAATLTTDQVEWCGHRWRNWALYEDGGLLEQKMLEIRALPGATKRQDLYDYFDTKYPNVTDESWRFNDPIFVKGCSALWSDYH